MLAYLENSLQLRTRATLIENSQMFGVCSVQEEYTHVSQALPKKGFGESFTFVKLESVTK